MEYLTSILQQWRVRLGHLFTLVVLFCARPGVTLLLIGTVVTLLGLAVRLAAAGCIQKDQVLSRNGPYAYTRNPLYVGSFLMMLGFCVAAGNVWVLAAFVPFFFAVYYATIFREEQFLKNKFGQDYIGFCRKVPRFFPRVTPAVRSHGAWFSLKQALANHEYEGALAALVVLALLWALGLTGFSPSTTLIK